MTIKELQERLISENIDIRSYCINDSIGIGECYCIIKNYNKWEVFYSERGNKNNLTIFYSEEEACEYFYNWLTDSIIIAQ